MVAPVRVVEVPAMSDKPDEKSEVEDFSQLTTLPVFPEMLISAGLEPEHMLWSELMLPPTLAGSTDTVTIAEVASEQEPD